MSNQFKKMGSITIFFIIAVSLRYYVAIIKPNFLQNINMYSNILLYGIGPLIGGLFVVKVLNRPNFLKIFGLNFFKTIIIVAIPMVLFSLVGIIKTGTPYINVPKYVGIMILYALFEEYGWRGYLQSELKGVKKLYKYLLITVLWFVWHLNFEISLSNLIFFLALFGGSYGIGYLADKSKSLIMSAVFHSFFNIAQIELLNGIELKYKIVIILISALSAIYIMNYNTQKAVVSKA